MNNKLELLRENADLTKRQISKILGVSDSIYSRWEKGKDIIPTKRLYELANYYKINIDYILGLTNEKIYIESSEPININLISQRIRTIRKNCNETLREFSKRLNTTSSTISAYETGKVLILCAFLIEICKFSNISADWILGRRNEMYIKKTAIKVNESVNNFV